MTASPLMQAPGAVPGDGLDAGVAAHYGDPLREQRLLTEGLGVVDLSHRGVVTVTGPDRLSWLHSLTSQQLVDLPPRTSTETLVLTPKGHVERALHVVDDGESTWLGVEPGTASGVVEWLDRMRFMLRVEVADVSDDYAVLGEGIARELAAAGATLMLGARRTDRLDALAAEAVAAGEGDGSGGGMSLTDLVETSLQKNTDRLIIGEVVGSEVLAMLQARLVDGTRDDLLHICRHA